MELIVTAIVAALGKLSETAVMDGYKTLKDTIAKKFGKGSDLMESVEKIEKKPESKGQLAVLKEELVAAKADQDEELVRAAESLLEKIKSQPGGQQGVQHVQQWIQGNQNITSGTGDITVNPGSRKE